MPLVEIQNKVEAWNNIAAFIKFLSLEEYIKRTTMNDIIKSLNELTPEEFTDAIEEATQKEIEPQKEYIQAPGFMREEEQIISIITKELIAALKEIFNGDETHDNEKLTNKIKLVLRNHIGISND